MILSGGSEGAPIIENMGEIRSDKSLGMADLMATFKVTNDNLQAITSDFKGITSGIVSGKGTVGGLFQDSSMYQQIQRSVNQARLASSNTAQATKELSNMMANINAGKGMVGALLNDPGYEKRLDESVTSVQSTLKNASGTVDRLNSMTDELKVLVQEINNPNSPLGVMMTDSVFARNLQQTMDNLQGSTGELDETLDNAQRSFFLRENIFRKNKEYRKKNQNKVEAGNGPRGN